MCNSRKVLFYLLFFKNLNINSINIIIIIIIKNEKTIIIRTSTS
jgi:hypothetical protein